MLPAPIGGDLLGCRRGAARNRNASTVIAALVERDRAIGVAARRLIGTGEIFDRVGQVGFGIEQAGRGAGISNAARGRVFDLHQAERAAAIARMRIIAALARHDAMHKRFRQAVRRRMARDHRVECAMRCARGRRIGPLRCGLRYIALLPAIRLLPVAPAARLLLPLRLRALWLLP